MRALAAHAAVDPATSVAAGVLERLAPGACPLIVNEPSGRLFDALHDQGAKPQVWSRYAGPACAASPWPAPGPYTAAFVRLSKAKNATDLALHAAASMLSPGAQMVLFGANNEGIRSAGAHLVAVADAVTTVDTRRHCRVLAGSRRAVIAGHRPTLAAWRREGEVVILGEARRWVSYPGLFAGGGLDGGTALLLDHLPALAAGARVLDFGCGTGIIAAGLLEQGRGTIDVLDADALALEAARENVPDARLLLGDGLGATGATRYDAILSNPPIHDGVAEDHGALERLIAKAPRHLVAGGILQIVVQRRVKAADLMREAFGNVAVVGETGRYTVLRSKKEEAIR